MNVLSVFDGMAGARLALQRAGITPANYFAVEIDKHARAIADHNFPDIRRPAHDARLLKKNAVIKLPTIDLLVAGFPCQSFSIAGKKRGMADKRGALLLNLLRLRRWCKPKVFLFENPPPLSAFADELNLIIGVAPVIFNSHHYGAQHRRRAYWCNRPLVAAEKIHPQMLADILLPPDHPERVGEKVFNYEPHPPTGRRIKIVGRKATVPASQTARVASGDGKSDAVTNGGKNAGAKQSLVENKIRRNAYFVADAAGKGRAVTAKERGETVAEAHKCRLLTTTEKLRLQGFPDGYISAAVAKSNAQRAIGNAFDVNVVTDILCQLKKDLTTT